MGTKPKIATLKPLVAMVKHQGPRVAGGSFGDASRLSASQRGYGYEWRKTRERILKRDGYICRCQRCAEDKVIRPAHAVDHRIPKFEGGSSEDDNLQAINDECHAIKSEAEAKRARGLGIILPDWTRTTSGNRDRGG